jgi:Xaa-Pro aminopeptidase
MTTMTTETRPVIANIPRLHDFMDRNRMAAVVVRSGNNFTYLSGIAYPGTLARHLDLAASVRGVLLVWPRHGEPVIILDYAADLLTRQRSWVRRIEVYEPYVETAHERLTRVLADLGLDRERVGLERDALPVAHWEEIQRRLPGLGMADCGPMMEEVRWVKTPGEIAAFRRGADLLDDVYAEVFPTITTGETEREVHSRMIASCLRRGAGWAHGILNSSTNQVLYGGEGDTRFERGDLVRTDYVAYVDGYPGHQSRMAVMGPPSAEQRRQYALTREIHLMAIDRCRPGTLASDVYAAVAGAYARHGITYTASLVGHGVGAWFHQQEPILARSRKIPLEEGMVLALEPYRESWHIQDMVVVRPSGPELISARFPTGEMFVIPG